MTHKQPIQIRNTTLYNELYYIEPIWYKIPSVTIEEVNKTKEVWRELLLKHGIEFSPYLYHKHKVKKRIELEDRDKNELHIYSNAVADYNELRKKLKETKDEK